MTTSARFTWNGDQWAKGVLPGALAKAINAGASHTVNKFKNALGRKRGLDAPASIPGMPPVSRQGGLSRSIAFSAATPGRYISRIGPTISYAAILEKGGTITAKTSRNLTVPLNREARQLRTRHKESLRALNGFVMKRPGAHPLLIIPKYGKSGKRLTGGDAVFLLTPRVTIQARPFIKPTFERAKPSILDHIRNSLRANLRAAI